MVRVNKHNLVVNTGKFGTGFANVSDLPEMKNSGAWELDRIAARGRSSAYPLRHGKCSMQVRFQVFHPMYLDEVQGVAKVFTESPHQGTVDYPRDWSY